MVVGEEVRHRALPSARRTWTWAAFRERPQHWCKRQLMTERITFTRQQIYELVWEKPMSRLAAESSVANTDPS